jgi:hypothetical protein
VSFAEVAVTDHALRAEPPMTKVRKGRRCASIKPALGEICQAHLQRLTRDKMVKRQMFGRASLPLLRKRVLLTAQN